MQTMNNYKQTRLVLGNGQRNGGFSQLAMPTISQHNLLANKLSSIYVSFTTILALYCSINVPLINSTGLLLTVLVSMSCHKVNEATMYQSACILPPSEIYLQSLNQFKLNHVNCTKIDIFH